MAQVYLTRGDLHVVWASTRRAWPWMNRSATSKGQGRLAASNGAGLPEPLWATWTAPWASTRRAWPLKEQIGDRQGQGRLARLNMAQVYLTCGDLDRALGLYEESLALKEQIGDRQGKAASLLSNGAGLPDALGQLDCCPGPLRGEPGPSWNRSATGRARPPRCIK